MKYRNIEFHTQDYLQKMIKMSSIRQGIITGLCFTALASCSFFADGGPQSVVIEANNPSWILHVDGKQVGENGRATVQLDRTRAHVVSATQGNKRVTEMIEMGLSVTGDKVISSGEATTIHLNKRKPGAKIYLVGTPVLEQEFKDAGFILTDKDPDFVVVGFDTTVTYEKLWKLCDFVRAGVEYICTHPDFNCPIEGGYMPDIGGIIAFVEACTGKRPDKIIGKPYHYIVDAVMEKLGVEKDQVAMVGDRLYTDIAMGKNSGITSILVLSGETTLEDLKTSDVQPDYTFEHLGKIAEQL